MRPTLPVPLLVFLQLASSTPIPLQQHFPSNCLRISSCPELHSPAHTPPPSRPLNNPHFPSHQLSSSSSDPIPFADQRPLLPPNSPLSPPPYTNIPVSEILSAPVPLTTEYLESVTHSSPDSALPAKPTSALPSLREEDARRYWADLYSGKPAISAGEKGERPSCSAKNTNGQGEWVYLRRDPSDLLVVGIVFIFLLAVVVIEGVDRLRDLYVPFPFHSIPIPSKKLIWK